jgi:hypothetical protein
MTRRPDQLPDWFFGGAGKRALLRTIVTGQQDQLFSQKALAAAAGLHEKGGAERHLRVLLEAGLLEREGPRGGYRVQRSSPLFVPLSAWVAAIDEYVSADAQLPPARGGRSSG